MESSAFEIVVKCQGGIDIPPPHNEKAHLINEAYPSSRPRQKPHCFLMNVVVHPFDFKGFAVLGKFQRGGEPETVLN